METAIADLPADLRWLFESGAVGIEQLAALHDGLGVTSLGDLIDAVEGQAIRAVPGFNKVAELAIAAALPTVRRSIPRIPLGRATALAEPLLDELRSMSGVVWAETAGSLRRAEDTIGDVLIVAAIDDPRKVIHAVPRLPGIDRLLHQGARQVCVQTTSAQVAIRFPETSRAGATLLHLTGARAHVKALDAYAATRGWQLTRDGLHRSDGAASVGTTEEEVYGALGLPVIPPEIRNGDDEVEVAARGELPTLLTRADIRGDLHMHTTWSDGQDSIEAMVTTCLQLGYEYVAITDHSPRSGATRTLAADAVSRQAEEIAAVRQRCPGIAILHGCEVDILSGGALDFPDSILARFDIVLASLHHTNGHSPEQLLARYVSAMRHPLVSVITHPANRLVPHRRGYDLDYDRLFETAVETGTCLEVDGAPAHLDMEGALARRAVAAGVTVTVTSDCHRADLLGRQMRLGVATARRGWVEPRHVLNARPLERVREAILRKRRAE